MSDNPQPVLTSVASDLWTISLPLKLLGLPLGTRTNVVRLPSGDIWLHSPGPLAAEHCSAISGLGPVRWIVGPNRFHNLHIARAVAAFPDATLVAAQSLVDHKKGKLPVHEVLEPGRSFEGAIESLLIEGMPKIGEHVFFHAPSKTLILTDTCFNFVEPEGWLFKTFLKLNKAYDCCGPSRFARSTIKDPGATRASIDRMLEWPFERVLVCHGEPVEADGQATIRNGWSFLE